MTDRPILFSGAMVRALLDGSKSQTRRSVRRQPWASCSIEEGDQGEPSFVYSALHGDGPGHDVDESRTPCVCPYGQPGDRLWVRETWAFERNAIGSVREEDGPFVYRATDSEQHRLCDRWRPSIHMPRAASRILLEITGVRVERLQDIGEEDAIAEGIEQMPCEVPDTRLWRNYDLSNGWTPRVAIPRNSYRSLWESINGAGSWDANLWVWVVEFKRVMP